MSKSVLYLARHGKTRDNIPGFTRPSNSDVGLNEIGKKEAQEIGEQFKKDEISPLIYTAPAVRTKQTAEIIAEIAKSPVKVDPGLDSWNYGDIALEEDLKPYQENWTRTPPGGEPYGNFAWKFKKTLTVYWLSAEPILLVTHSRNLYLLQFWVEGLPEIPVTGMETGLLFELKTKLKD